MPEKWTSRDLAALAEAADKRGPNWQWPSTINRPDRGAIAANKAKRRWSKVKQTADASADVKRPRRESPVRERATKVGVAISDNTPQGLRETIANPGASPCAARYARRLLHQHQKAARSCVALAEVRAEARGCRYVKFDIDVQNKN
jgi:hypothetical protein